MTNENLMPEFLTSHSKDQSSHFHANTLILRSTITGRSNVFVCLIVINGEIPNVEVMRVNCRIAGEFCRTLNAR